MILDNKTPKGDGNNYSSPKSTEDIKILDNKTPKGDGNRPYFLFILFSNILDNKTPKGDGNFPAAPPPINNVFY